MDMFGIKVGDRLICDFEVTHNLHSSEIYVKRSDGYHFFVFEKDIKEHIKNKKPLVIGKQAIHKDGIGRVWTVVAIIDDMVWLKCNYDIEGEMWTHGVFPVADYEGDY